MIYNYKGFKILPFKCKSQLKALKRYELILWILLGIVVSSIPDIKDDIRYLKDLEEAVGILLQVSEQDGFCVAMFKWGAIALPVQMAPRLKGLQGRRCAILRLDNEYYVREA
jgi:hypothetical protein